VDAQEVEHERGDRDRRGDLSPGHDGAIAVDQLVHGGIDKARRHGAEPQAVCPIGHDIDDVVRSALPRASRDGRELVQVSMQLENKSGRDIHAERVGTHCGQDVSIAGDLLLGSVSRRRLLGSDLGHAPRRRGHTLDPVRLFDALDSCDLAERAQHVSRLLLEQLLLTLVLAEEADEDQGS
jgi:hypothetical protein